MLFFKTNKQMLNVCFDMKDGSIIIDDMNAVRLASYSLFTFKERQLTISELDKNQNDLILQYLTVYDYKMAEFKEFYQIEKPTVVGYSDGAQNFHDLGFICALNKVWELFSSKAKREAYQFLKDCTDYAE